MSLNQLVGTDSVLDEAVLSTLISERASELRLASTEQRRGIIEAEILSRLQDIYGLNIDYDVKKGDSANAEYFRDVFGLHKSQALALQSGIQAVARKFLSYYNVETLSTKHLISRMKELRQKNALLELWDSEEAEYAVSEKFFTDNQVDNDFGSRTALEIHQDQGVCTLPVRREHKVSFKRVRIANGSKGTPGNSDIAVTTNNRLQYLQDGNDNTYFDYERIGAPSELWLRVEFPEPTVINKFVLAKGDTGLGMPFEVLDIVYSDSEFGQLSIFELQPLDELIVEESDIEDDFQIVHLPVRVTAALIKVRQDNSYKVPVASNDFQSVYRDRYPISISRLEFARLEFDSQGSLNSIGEPLPGGLYASTGIVGVWPKKRSLYDLKLDGSYDGGASWQDNLMTDEGIQTMVLPGEPGEFVWRLGLSRVDEAFSEVTSITGKAVETDIEQRLESIGTGSSPTEIQLSSRPSDGSVWVIQPRIARRGTVLEALQLGNGLGRAQRLNVPLDILRLGLEDHQLQIFVDGIKWTKVRSSGTPSSANWKFTDNRRQIEFGDDLASNSEVKFVLKPEWMLFEQRGDGFYHQMELPFDPAIENIEVVRTPRGPQRKVFIVPKGQTTIDLEYKSIDSSTWELVSDDGTTWTEVSTIENVDDAQDNDYMVDYQNGILYLASPVIDTNLVAIFEHRTPERLPSSAIEPVFVDERPWGVRIKTNRFSTETITDKIGDAPARTPDPVESTYESQSNPFSSSTTKKKLSRGRIVRGTVKIPDELFTSGEKPREVEYVDGFTEFKGIATSDNEQTNEEQAGSTGIIEFYLGARAFWIKDFGVTFSNTNIFKNKQSDVSSVNSTNDYHVADDGKVTVHVGANGILPSGITINYLYQDPDYDGNSAYSIDYKNGVFYAGSALETTAELTYQAASYQVLYDVAKPLKARYRKSLNVVEVNTENLEDTNNQIKLIWQKPRFSVELTETKDYFSPIVDIIGFRFR